MSSKLFKEKYENFINLLISRGKINSKSIERMLNIKGYEVRKLAQHARCSKIPVCSSQEGYWVGTLREIRSTIDHMNERASSILFTSQRLQGYVDKKVSAIEIDPKKCEQLSLFC